MSIWDAFIDDYEHRRKNLLKRIQLMEARAFQMGDLYHEAHGCSRLSRRDRSRSNLGLMLCSTMNTLHQR